MSAEKKIKKNPEVRFPVSPDKLERIRHQAERLDTTMGGLAKMALMEKINLLEAQEAQGAGPQLFEMLQKQFQSEAGK